MNCSDMDVTLPSGKMDSNSKIKVDSGDFVLNLLLPNSIVQSAYDKDKDMYLSRWTREVLKLMVRDYSEGRNQRPYVILPSGSRTSSMRIPCIKVFDVETNKQISNIVNDTDLMVTHPDIVVGCSEGPLLLEFIPDQDNIGYGKVKAISGCEAFPQLFKSITDESGAVIKYLSRRGTTKYTLRESTEYIKLINCEQVGPALARLNSQATYSESKASHTTKADIVVAIMSEKDYFRTDIEAVMMHSSWPSEIKASVLSTPISMVSVTPKSCQDDGLTWRISHSMHELVIARSLSSAQRHIYMAIKYVMKYLVENAEEEFEEKQFSSYLLMNAFFAFCDLNPDRDWAGKRMKTIHDFYVHVIGCLSDHRLPQYFCPRNNLIKDLSAEWIDFHKTLFTFNDEAEITSFLLLAQSTWRMPYFELPIKSYWSGNDLTLADAKTVLMSVNRDAIIKLPLVRIVQTLWSSHEIWQSLIPSEDEAAQLSSRVGQDLHVETQVAKFWGEIFTEADTLVSQGKISRTKYICLMRLIPKMVPCSKFIPIVAEEKLDGHLCDTDEEKALETYYEVQYVDHGELFNCIIKCNNDNIIIELLNEAGDTYVFPYTDHLLLHSAPFNYFNVCYKNIKKFNVTTENVQNYIAAFLEKRFLTPELPNHPIVKLYHILKNAFSKEPLVFYDVEDFKLQPTSGI